MQRGLPKCRIQYIVGSVGCQRCSHSSSWHRKRRDTAYFLGFQKSLSISFLPISTLAKKRVQDIWQYDIDWDSIWRWLGQFRQQDAECSGSAAWSWVPGLVDRITKGEVLVGPDVAKRLVVFSALPKAIDRCFRWFVPKKGYENTKVQFECWRGELLFVDCVT